MDQAEMKMNRWMCGTQRLVSRRHNEPRESLSSAGDIISMLRRNRSRWYGNVLQTKMMLIS